MKPTALLSLPGAEELELLSELDALDEDLSLLLPHAAATRARRRTAEVAAQLAERGEPWKSFFEPAVLADKLTAMGFSHSRTWTPDELNGRYFAGRADGLHIGAIPGRLLLAVV